MLILKIWWIIMEKSVTIIKFFFIISATILIFIMMIMSPKTRASCRLCNFWAKNLILLIHFYRWLKFFLRRNIFYIKKFSDENHAWKKYFFLNTFPCFFSSFCRPKFLIDQMSTERHVYKTLLDPKSKLAQYTLPKLHLNTHVAMY